MATIKGAHEQSHRRGVNKRATTIAIIRYDTRWQAPAGRLPASSQRPAGAGAWLPVRAPARARAGRPAPAPTLSSVASTALRPLCTPSSPLAGLGCLAALQAQLPSQQGGVHGQCSLSRCGQRRLIARSACRCCQPGCCSPLGSRCHLGCHCPGCLGAAWGCGAPRLLAFQALLPLLALGSRLEAQPRPAHDGKRGQHSAAKQEEEGEEGGALRLRPSQQLLWRRKYADAAGCHAVQGRDAPSLGRVCKQLQREVAGWAPGERLRRRAGHIGCYKRATNCHRTACRATHVGQWCASWPRTCGCAHRDQAAGVHARQHQGQAEQLHSQVGRQLQRQPQAAAFPHGCLQGGEADGRGYAGEVRAPHKAECLLARC